MSNSLDLPSCPPQEALSQIPLLVRMLTWSLDPAEALDLDLLTVAKDALASLANALAPVRPSMCSF